MNSLSWREWRPVSVDLANDVTTITHVPCLVKGLYVTAAMSAHDCAIKNGTETLITMPASSPVGASLDDDDGIRFNTNVIVQPDAAATGTVTLMYRVLREPW